MDRKIILASGSKTRAQLLINAGIKFQIDPSQVDEESIIESMENNKEEPYSITQALADIKALNRSKVWPDAIIVGADQVLYFNGKIFTKPKNKNEARTNLEQLSGNTHDLVTAASVAINDMIVWRHVCNAQMIMRKLSEEFLDDYIEELGSEIYDSVGAYKLEKNGAQLFNEVKGDFFCILGLPLLSLLNYFRENKILKS